MIRQSTGFVIKWATRRVPHVEQDLPILTETLKTPPVFGGVRVAQSLVFYVVSCVLLFSFCLSFLAMTWSVYFFYLERVWDSLWYISSLSHFSEYGTCILFHWHTFNCLLDELSCLHIHDRKRFITVVMWKKSRIHYKTFKTNVMNSFQDTYVQLFYQFSTP